MTNVAIVRLSESEGGSLLQVKIRLPLLIQFFFLYWLANVTRAVISMMIGLANGVVPKYMVNGQPVDATTAVWAAPTTGFGMIIFGILLIQLSWYMLKGFPVETLKNVVEPSWFED